MRYPIEKASGYNGTVFVSCPDFPEMDAVVTSEIEAEAVSADAIMGAAVDRMSVGDDVPLPSDRPGPATTLHPLNCETIKRYRDSRETG